MSRVETVFLSPKLSKFKTLRYFSQKKAVKTKKYTHTVNLPVTQFPLWIKTKERVKLDQSLHEKCRFSNLYDWQNGSLKEPEFILHDGPPYANGEVHMGHAMNKILKDIIMRRKLLEGRKVHYIPGWDCHGLPIELKALERNSKQNLSTLDIRKIAKNFALETIEKQKKCFEQWGVLGNWKSNCYFTFDKKYIQNQLQLFFQLYEKGLIYRSLKPIYWSPSSRTALAEAELEYNNSHTSTSLFLRLRLCSLPKVITPFIESKNVYAIVWTTTVWSLPSNKAIAYNPALNYSLIDFPDEPSNLYLVASELIKSLQEKFKPFQVVGTFSGEVLESATYSHPLDSESVQPFLAANYVSTDKGTGLVHVAPAHGPDDFLLGLRNKINFENLIDDTGCYTQAAGSNLEGLNIFSDGLEKILQIVRNNILIEEPFIHSYPYDWRTKKPIIIKASEQWFIDSIQVKDNAMECLKSVSMFGISSNKDLESRLKKRPYWCISRQRVWGVPVPAVYDSITKKPIISKSLIEHYCSLIEKVGIDFWWTTPTTELVPEQYLKEFNLTASEIEKGGDILDIWFDSGTSWSSVLGNENVADLYLEGVDQLTGWFQASLLTSVAMRNKAPFKNIFVHGYAVDGNGQKMSKSLGNVIHPSDIIAGGSNLEKQPAYGIDILRWWAAAHVASHSNIPVSDSVLQTCKDDVQRIRLVMKFLLGAVNDFKSTTFSVSDDMHLLIVDKYLLNCLREFLHNIKELHESYQFNHVCTTVINFIANQVSSFYCHITKDRLYCEAKDSMNRRACQFIISSILEVLLFSIAPILPHLTEEVYSYYPNKKENELYFFSSHKFNSDSWNFPEEKKIVCTALDVKNLILKKIPSSKNNWEFQATIRASPEVYKILQVLSEPELVELMQVSKVNLSEGVLDEPYSVDVCPVAGYLCERCRRYTAVTPNSLCSRCSDVVESLV